MNFNRNFIFQNIYMETNNISGFSLVRFRDPNQVPRIKENYHRVPRIREIGSLQIHTGFLTFSLKNPEYINIFSLVLLTSNVPRSDRQIYPSGYMNLRLGTPKFSISVLNCNSLPDNFISLCTSISVWKFKDQLPRNHSSYIPFRRLSSFTSQAHICCYFGVKTVRNKLSFPCAAFNLHLLHCPVASKLCFVHRRPIQLGQERKHRCAPWNLLPYAYQQSTTLRQNGKFQGKKVKQRASTIR